MKIDKMLLKAFYDKKCTDEDTRKVYEWLSDPANKDEVSELLSQLWEESDEEEPSVAVDFQGIFAHIIRNSSHVHPSREKGAPYDKANGGLLAGDRHRKRAQSFSACRIAAGLASMLIIGILGYKIFFEDRYFIYSTAYGEIKAITLPDGSDVMLNSNTTIKYAYNFNESRKHNDAPREVFLDGEAFFSVRRRAGSGASAVKFIVHANQVDVKVLGTSFNVSTRRGKTMVVLNSGRVRLCIADSGNRMNEMVMSPGELVEIVNTEKKFVLKKVVDAGAYSAWRHNKLLFDNTPIRDILNLIEDNFGYQVILHDKTLKNRLYTDTTPADNLDLLLTKLSKIYDLKITMIDRQIIIQTKN